MNTPVDVNFPLRHLGDRLGYDVNKHRNSLKFSIIIGKYNPGHFAYALNTLKKVGVGIKMVKRYIGRR